MDYKHILVPVDFSELSDKAIEAALNLAGRFQAKITLAHVIVLSQEDIDEEMRFQEYEEFIKRQGAQAREQIQLRREKVSDRKIPVDSLLLHGFTPADALLEHIKENA